MKPLEPERELEIELEYHERKKRRKPDRDFIDLWEAYDLLNRHVRSLQRYQQPNSDDM